MRPFVAHSKLPEYDRDVVANLHYSMYGDPSKPDRNGLDVAKGVAGLHALDRLRELNPELDDNDLLSMIGRIVRLISALRD